MFKKAMTLVFLFSLPNHVFAESGTVQDAQLLLKKGLYEQAFREGKSSETEQDTTVACRAALIQGGYFEKGDAAITYLHQAIDLCHRAWTQNEDNLVAAVSYALAVGLEGKRFTKVSYAKKARRILEGLEEKYPESGLIKGALGGWHAEVSAAGMMARVALGARSKTARSFFNTARMLRMSDIPLTLEEIKFLSRKGKKDRQRALEILQALRTQQIDNAFDIYLLNRSTGLETALEAGDKKRIALEVQKLTAFNGIEAWQALPVYPLPDEND